MPTKRIPRIFDFGDLRSGHFCDHIHTGHFGYDIKRRPKIQFLVRDLSQAVYVIEFGGTGDLSTGLARQVGTILAKFKRLFLSK